MTTSPIGRDILPPQKVTLSKKGFTFIEVMVALAIVSLGIVAILKVFVISLDRLDYLGNRLYATTLLDHTLVETSRYIRGGNMSSFSLLSSPEDIDVGARSISFKREVIVEDIKDFEGLALVRAHIMWPEDNRTIELSRFAYLSSIETLPANAK
jgi:prepilin-type N-terminal cleavage/methylation domain-containing protein